MRALAAFLAVFLAAVSARAQSSESLWLNGAKLFDGAAAVGVAPVVAASPAAAGKAAAGQAGGVEVITLSQLADRLAADPRAVDALIAAIKKASAKAPELGGIFPELGALDPAAQQQLAAALRSSDKRFLDAFPTMKEAQLGAFITAYGQKQGPEPDPAPPATMTLTLTGQPKQAKDGAFLKDWGLGLYHGDLTKHGQPFAYGDELAVVDALNGLALNEPGKPPVFTLLFEGKAYTSVADWAAALLASGHQLEARDRRFFTNFGGLWYKPGSRWISVVTPFWVDTGLVLPSGRKLIVPVTHSGIDFSIRGPKVNVEFSYYLGLGGSARFRALGDDNKPWVGGRVVRTWSAAGAADILSRAAVTRRDIRAKVSRYGLPMGGYGPLGVCNDVDAMITGAPIFPQIRDPRYYRDGMQIDAWAAAQPVDDGSTPPTLERVWDSLAVQDPAQLEIPQFLPTLLELKAALGK